ncbi:MAG: nuclear transport factor 2 family protein [Thermomicrobiales bacterium]
MTRTIMMATLLVLFLAIGLGMIVAATLQPSPALKTSVAESAPIVNGFYDAVNAAIASGDTTRLEAIVAPHFVDKEPLPGESADRDGLLAYLADLHRADPTTRLIPDVIAVRDGLAVVQVDIQHGNSPQQGVLRDQSRPWGPVDVLRLGDGQIIERWNQSDGLTIARLLAEASLQLPAPAPRVVTLSRITLAPTARWSFTNDGPAVLLPEDGASDLRATIAAPTASNVFVAAPSVRLDMDQPLIVPAGANAAVSNLAANPARLLAVTFTVPSMPDGLSSAPLPSGVEMRVLAGGLATDVTSGMLTLDLSRVTLAHGADLTLSEADGPTLVALDHGGIELRSAATTWRRRAEDGVSEQVRESTLAAGDGALIRADGFTLLANTSDDDASALVLSLRAAP